MESIPRIETAKRIYYKYRFIVILFSLFMAGGAFFRWVGPYLDLTEQVMAVESKHDDDINEIKSEFHKVHSDIDSLQSDLRDIKIITCITAQKDLGVTVQECIDL